MGEVRVSGPRYQQVAVDIAAKIASRQYQVGERIYARSLLSSAYAVSPETARRAVGVLADLGIVKANRGSGVEILSWERANQFLRQYEDVETLSGRRRKTLDHLSQLYQQAEELKKEVQGLVEYTEQFQWSNPLVPYEALVRKGSSCVGKSLRELNFWQNTGATVVAVRHGDQLVLSPGPHQGLALGDTVYFVGNESSVQRVAHLLEAPAAEPQKE